MFRRRSEPPPPPPPRNAVEALDLRAVPPRLVGVVEQAIDAHRRWHDVVAAMASGPIAARLTELGAQVEAGVLEVHATAVRVGEVERVLDALDPRGATDAYKRAKRQAADGAPPPEMDALEARFSSVQRMMNLVTDSDEKLRVLDARLLAAVARGAEVALTADLASLSTLGTDLDGVVSELGTLRSALASL